MSATNFCLYFHINPIKQEVFYVGMGDLERPYYKGENRSAFWHNEVKKYGYNVVIIHENLTRREACELEKKYITQIGRRDLGLGPLVNLTDGGDGGATNKGKSMKGKTCYDKWVREGGGDYAKDRKKQWIEKSRLSRIGLKKRQHSEETKKKLSIINKGKKVSTETRLKLSKIRKGKTYQEIYGDKSQQIKENISKSARGKFVTLETRKKQSLNHQGMKGKTHSKETRLKQSLAHKGKKNIRYGTHWITKDGVSIQVKKEKLNSYIKLGWLKGRVIKK